MAMRRSRLLTRPAERRSVPAVPRDADLCSLEQLCPREIPLDPELAAPPDPGPGCGVAYVPPRWDMVPVAARQALSELTSVSLPHEVLVVLAGVRRVAGATVYCPIQALAAGHHAVALWVDDLPFDRAAAVPAHRDIRMVERVVAAGSANPSFLGATRRFSVHDRCLGRVSRRGLRLQDLLMRIRPRAAGLTKFVGRRGDGRKVGEWAPLTLGLGGSRVVLSFRDGGRCTRAPWRRPDPGAWRTLILTDRELVVLRGFAARSAPGGGMISRAVPRHHLRQLKAIGAGRCVDAEATHTFPLGAAFARRVVRELSESVGLPPSCRLRSRTPEDAVAVCSYAEFVHVGLLIGGIPGGGLS